MVAARMTARAARARATQRQQGVITALTAARKRVAQQQWRRWQWQQGSGRGQRGGNNSGESGGNVAKTAARTIARDMRQDKGNAVIVTGYHGDSGGEVGSGGGDESEGQRGNNSGVQR
jgi:hypothetical protein